MRGRPEGAAMAYSVPHKERPAASGCHGGAETMREAARAAGKSEMLEKLAADYPKGPHDQPQSMCPAFGSLRVGLRCLGRRWWGRR